jgi:hypothetical protein
VVVLSRRESDGVILVAITALFDDPSLHITGSQHLRQFQSAALVMR